MGMNNGGGCTYKVFVLSHTKNAQFSSVFIRLLFFLFYLRRSEIPPYKILYLRVVCVVVCKCVKIKSRCSFYLLNAIRRISISTNHSERGRTRGTGVLVFFSSSLLTFYKALLTRIVSRGSILATPRVSVVRGRVSRIN